MARQKSDDKRNAIVDAAIRVIAEQGLGAPTATIAREAGIANGSLFTYFETKADLFNHVYLEVKTEMANAALDGRPAKASLRAQTAHVWANWMRWATQNPQKRRALALLGVSDELTPQARAAGHQTMLELAALMEQARAKGPMRGVPFALAMGLMNALADATMDFMATDPKHAETHSQTGFEALWRMLG